jgi:hypothetical protein
MIDYFSLALTHGLILLAVWRILQREELDDERASKEKAAPPGKSI